MGITRRTFLKHSAATAAGTWAAPWLRHPLVSAALGQTLADRFFVVVYLDGGNDGLNTVVPVENGSRGRLREAYEMARHSGVGGLRIAAAELRDTTVAPDLGTQTSLALHPALAGLGRLYQRGDVAILQGCGAPQYSMSHEVARRVWQFGDPLDEAYPNSGWLGRYLASHYEANDIAALSVRSDVAAELIQNVTNVLAIPRLREFTFPYDTLYPQDESLRREAFLAIHENALRQMQSAIRFVGNSGAASLRTSERYPPLSDTYRDERAVFDAAYESTDSDFARDLREVASVLYAVKQGVPEIGLRVFEVQSHGYDTHSDQGAAGPDSVHARLLQQIGDGLEVFAHDCIDMGVWDQVCVLVYTEFGRRVPQNANGTDHGSQGPLFVVGGQVKAGVYGNHPNLNADALDENGNTPYSQADDDPYRSLDFRDVYGTILRKWLGVADPTLILGLDAGDPRQYWTVPNFALPFLSST